MQSGRVLVLSVGFLLLFVLGFFLLLFLIQVNTHLKLQMLHVLLQNMIVVE